MDVVRVSGWRAAGLALAACLAAAVAGAQGGAPTLEAAVARGVLDAEVLEALAGGGPVRVVAVYARGPAADPALRARAARERLAGPSFVPGRHFERLPVLAGWIEMPALAALVADPHLRRASLERVVRAQLGQSVPLVRLDWMRAAGFTGGGVEVAVLDTGVDLAHPDLAGSVVDEKCYCDDGVIGPAGCCPDNDRDEDQGPGSAQDDHGHGTRVASILTSDGVHAALGGAPDVGIVAVKVLNSMGTGYTTDLLQGLQWVEQNHPGIPVMNMSLGFGLYAGDCDAADANTMAFSTAIGDLRDAGTLSVAGAGNNGSGSGMIAPACLADAFSVSAVWDQALGSQTWFGCTDATTAPDQVTCWSNSSTTTDLFAPGARMSASALGGTTVTLAGTSYAAPMAAACAAILADEVPSADPDDLEMALLTSGVSVTDATNGLSFPRLDCVAAYHALPEPAAALQLVCGAGLLAALARHRRRL